MADITISPDEIRDALKDFVAGYQPTASATTEVGTVIDAGDGIAHVEGLPGAMANELLRFADGTLGLALNLDESEIGVIVLGEFTGIVEGMEVTRTGEVLSVPVGDAFLGRVVDTGCGRFSRARVSRLRCLNRDFLVHFFSEFWKARRLGRGIIG
mgnify:CR=1 FL=1